MSEFFKIVGMYVCAVLGVFFVSCVLGAVIGKVIAYGNRRLPERPTGRPHYTVIWRENEYMDSAFTGELDWLDYDRLLISKGDEAVMVERKDIKEMF